MIGGAALGIWMDVDASGLDDFNAWYRRQHLPERLSVPGFLRGRRYEADGSPSPRYFTLYETTDASVLSSALYLERLNAPTDWTRRALPLVRRMIRNAYRCLATSGPDARAGRLVTVRIQPHSGRGPYVRASLFGDTLGALGSVGVPAAAVFESETAGTSVVTEERKIVGGDVTAAPPFLVLCELGDDAASDGVAAYWRGWGTRLAADITVDVYRLLYGLEWTPAR
jgi:hypothetical protein